MAKLLLGVSNSGGKVATTSIELIAAIPIEPNAIFIGISSGIFAGLFKHYVLKKPDPEHMGDQA